MPVKRFSIGRALDCDVVLADPSISRRHAELELLDQSMTLTDCQSTHGTHVVDGGRARRLTREAVRPTTRVQLGDLTLTVGDLLEAIRFKSPPPSGPSPSPAPGAKEIPRPHGTRLVRCGCGVIKPHGTICPGCGQ